jgi:cell division protein FtsB
VSYAELVAENESLKAQNAILRDRAIKAQEDIACFLKCVNEMVEYQVNSIIAGPMRDNELLKRINANLHREVSDLRDHIERIEHPIKAVEPENPKEERR